MPNYAHHTFEGGGVAIWHITETSAELYAQLATHRYDASLQSMTNEGRRAEWVAVRLLVKQLFGSECEVAYHPTGRPYLKDCDVHISISHTRGYAAVAYSTKGPIGLDIEHISDRVERIATRFTSQSESQYIDLHTGHERLMYHLINWSAKETLYKLYDAPTMTEFKVAFHVAPYQLSESGLLTVSVSTGDEVKVCYRVSTDFVCTWAVGF